MKIIEAVQALVLTFGWWFRSEQQTAIFSRYEKDVRADSDTPRKDPVFGKRIEARNTQGTLHAYDIGEWKFCILANQMMVKDLEILLYGPVAYSERALA